MGTTEQLRSRSARALGVGMMAMAVAGLVSTAADGAHVLLTYGAPVGLLGLLGWAAFWEPYVEVSDGGVTVANTLRTVQVPWPAIDEVDGRYGLKLLTAYGPVTAWAAGAPAGRQRARSRESATSAAVSSRLEELRAAGHLDTPRLERPALTSTWHRTLLTAITVLLVGTVLLPFVA